MRIFAYEMVTAGGLPLPPGEPLPVSLLREGRAMLEALATDLAACRDVQVDVLCDARHEPLTLPAVRVTTASGRDDEAWQFERLASAADAVIVVAPETAGLLAARSRWASSMSQLLGPELELIELASDKDRTARFLANVDIATPSGICLAPGEPLPRDFSYPAVLKPRDGAGSQETYFIADVPAAERQPAPSSAARLEHYCPGRAASVAAIAGPRERIILPPCWQRLSDDGRFRYLGGATIVEESLRERATELAHRVLQALPEPRGYLGIDLILGQDPHGRDDRVIEINPRLTTSYIGLRAAARGNLAQAWLDLAAGRRTALSFADTPVQFDADGTIRFTPQTMM
ncbi:MAG: ATP-grasp domain-containing protein [Pirellulales bacterium]|nr:ATP-grasp domain-containing protein [Pirellulales bacterium]